MNYENTIKYQNYIFTSIEFYHIKHVLFDFSKVVIVLCALADRVSAFHVKGIGFDSHLCIKVLIWKYIILYMLLKQSQRSGGLRGACPLKKSNLTQQNITKYLSVKTLHSWNTVDRYYNRMTLQLDFKSKEFLFFVWFIVVYFKILLWQCNAIQFTVIDVSTAH